MTSDKIHILVEIYFLNMAFLIEICTKQGVIIKNFINIAFKALLLNFQMDGFLFEYPWHPKIVDTQILQIGNILIVAIPGEITTMAGRFVIQISNNLFIIK